MDDEIQFGDVQFDEPDRSVRPDRDGHFAVVLCGEAADRDLPIFVDLDVMRDMEAHSQTDKTVELGGVLLGRRSLDRDGREFVVVTDCLRADHYESTQSRFKFTHDTWSDITRRRGDYPNGTEMVGWYHTHPGWGIFLSDMDLFICNNFFNRPLDVALVIDPCKGKRGWFQWTDPSAKKTRETAGFYLMSSRHRESELEYFGDLYNGLVSMNDPRYSEVSRSSGGSGSPIVNVSNSRNPMFDFAVLGMLAMQFILLSLIAYRMMAPPAPVALENQEQALELKTLERGYAELRSLTVDIVDPEGENKDRLDTLFSKFEEARNENVRLASGYDAQLVHTEKLKKDSALLQANLSDTQSEIAKIEKDYEEAREDLHTKMERVEELEKAIEDGDSDSSEDEGSGMEFGFAKNWWWAALGSIMAAIAGVMGTLFYLRRYSEDFFDDDESNDSVEDEASSFQE